MSESDPTAAPRFRRLDAEELERRLRAVDPPLLLDVRRGAAFDEQPGIPAAIPFALDVDPILIPDVPRRQAVVAYCL